MKKILSSLLAFVMVITMVCMPVGAITPEELETQLDAVSFTREFDVDVPTDMQITEADGIANTGDYTNFNFAGDNVTLDYKASIDMQPVRDLFQYSLIGNATVLGLTDDVLNEVEVKSQFKVYIKMSETVYNSIANPGGLAVAGNMEGFVLDSADVNITDVYIDTAREWTHADGEHTLCITLEAISPTGTGPLTAGDLREGVGAPYATRNFNDYLADIYFVVEDIVYPVSETPVKETVWGYIDGYTDFVYEDEVTIAHVDYKAVQKDGESDTLATWKPEFEADSVKSKRVSTTFELRAPNQIKLTFVVNGTYLVPPKDSYGNSINISGVDFTDIIDPVYGDTEIFFDASEYKITRDHGKRTKYTFKGWAETPGGEPIGDTTFTTDKILYAVFSTTEEPGGSSKITLNFCVDGEYNVVSPISDYAPINIVLKDLVVPEKEGFKFDGWYYDGAYTNKVADPFTTSVSTTLYARYVKSDVPPVLDGDVHFVYVIGYPEGDVRPENNISREEVATIFYRLLKKDVRDGIFTDDNNFADVEKGRWSNKAVSTMANGGYVKGYEDGTFRPGAFITRAEFATMAARFLEDKTAIRANFSDIAGHWAESYIKLVAGNGWVNGYEDGTFKPDNYITRAEAMAIINRILVRYVNDEGLHADAKHWPDNARDAWYYFDVLEATNAHDFVRQEDGIHETWKTINENNVWAEKPQYEDAE